MNPTEVMRQLEESRAVLLKRCGTFPKVVIILGSGLSTLLEEMVIEEEISFNEIPHFRPLTVEGHPGRVVIGKLATVRVAAVLGRLHYYEGHTMQDVVFPVRSFAWAGAEMFVLTNAAGALQAALKPPSLVLIRDHVNMMGTNPLIGPNLQHLGPRFPDMTYLYDRELRKAFKEAAKEIGLPLSEGVYVGLHGPSYETPAEIKTYQILGGDVVGMSTIPEAIALHHMGKRVVAVSCVTNSAAGVEDRPLVHSEVLENAMKIREPFARLIRAFLGRVK